MTNNTKPSIIHIIQSDYAALFGVLLPIVLLIMYVAIAYFGYLPGLRGHNPIQGTKGAPFLFYLFIIGLVVGPPLTFWRIRSIQKLFSKSVEVIGEITNISFFRDRGRVEYSYKYQDKGYSSGNTIMKTKLTQKLHTGNQVVLLINPDEPKHVLVRDLYV